VGWTFYNSSGQRLSSAATNISVLDIDGATDIGAAIVDADLFIIDDGAGGTNRKTAASRIKTYVEDAAGEVPIANLDIDGGTDIGANIVDADLFIIDDGAGGTNRKTAASRIKTYVGAAPSQSNQAAMEAETNEDTYCPPDLMVFHPGVAKAWAEFGATGTLQDPSFNITSVAKESTGLYLVTFDDDFSDNNHVTPMCPTGDIIEFVRLANATGSIKFRSKSNGTLTDSGCTFSAHGDR